MKCWSISVTNFLSWRKSCQNSLKHANSLSVTSNQAESLRATESLTTLQVYQPHLLLHLAVTDGAVFLSVLQQAVRSSKKGCTRCWKALRESAALPMMYSSEVALMKSTTAEHACLWNWNLPEQRQVSLWIERNPIRGPCSEQEGLKPDLSEIEAVLTMDPPKDKAGVERLRGTVNNLSRFLPKLSDLTWLISDLTHPDAEWTWESVHDSAFEELRHLLMQAPVLTYFDWTKELSIQCDASG